MGSDQKQSDAGVYGFTAATQEVFGRFGTGAWNLLKSMAERAEQEGRVCKETFVHNTLLHLSVALHRQAVAHLLGSDQKQSDGPLECCIEPWQLLGAKERRA